MQNSKKWSIIALLSVIALSLTYMLSTGQMSFSGLTSDVLSPNFICTESSLAGEANKYNANLTQYKTVSAEVQVLTANINTLNTEISALTNNKVNLEAENVSYSAEVKTLQSFIATNCNPPRPNVVAQCNQKKNKVTTLKAKITTNQTKIADLKNKITNKTNQVAIKQAQKDAKLAKLLQLSPKIAAYETCRLELTGKPTVASNVSGELKITSGEVSVSGEVNCKTKIVSGEAVFISGEVKAPNISGEVMNASGEVKIKTILQVNVDSMVFLVKPTPENNLQIKEWFLAMGEGKNETRTSCTSSQSSSVPVELKVTCTTPKPYTSANVIAPGAKTPFKLIGRLGSIDAPLTVKTQLREFKYNGGRTDIYDMTKEAVLMYTAAPIKLFSVEIDSVEKTADVNYCKNFDTCAHMYESGNVIDTMHTKNLFCPKTGPITDIPLADLPLLKEGMKVRLKHGNESIWSNDVVVTSKKIAVQTYTQTSWTCYDGVKKVSNSCTTLAESRADADKYCINHCSASSGKCGVNSFSAGQVCTAQVCGNTIREGAEQCDDGNTKDGDGCSSTCTLETVVTPTRATAVSNAAGTIATITNPGFGYPSYTSSPIVTVTGGTCTKLPTATAIASLGVVNSIILTGAVNCTVAPIITIAEPLPNVCDLAPTLCLFKFNQPILVPEQSTYSQYVIGGSTSKATFNVPAEGSGTVFIKELKFKASDVDSVISVQIGDIVAPFVGGIAHVRGLNIPVQGGSKENMIAATLLYSEVGVNGIDSGTKVMVTLTDIVHMAGAVNTTVGLSTSVNTPTMTLVRSKPSFIQSASVSGLTMGRVKIGTILIAADTKGDIKINDIVFNVSTKNITNFALSNPQIRDFNNNMNIADSLCSYANGIGVSCSFGTQSDADYDGYDIPAGSSKTFALYADITGILSSNYDSYVSTSLDQGLFNWDDTSTNGQNGTNLNGKLLYDFPTGSYMIKQ